MDSQRKAIIALVLLIIIGVIVSSNLKPLYLGGGKILGAYDALLTKSSKLSGKDVIRVFASVGQGSESMQILFDKDKLEELLKNRYNKDYIVENTVTGNLYLVDAKKVFGVDYGNRKVYSFIKKRGYTCTSVTDTCDNACRNEFGSTAKFAVAVRNPSPCSWYAKKCICYYEDLKIGEVDDVGAVVEDIRKVRVSIEGLGTKETTIVGSSGGNLKIGDKMYMEWTGDLFSGTRVNIPYSYVPAKSYRTGRFYLVPNSLRIELTNRINEIYEGLRDYINSNPGGCSWGACVYESSFESLANPNQLYSMIENNDRTQDFVRDYSNYIKDARWEGDRFIIDLKYAEKFPTFTVDLDAAWVGIYVSIPNPEISIINDMVELVKGSSSTVYFDVYNDADTSGQIVIEAECPQNMVCSVAPGTTWIEARETITGTVSVTTSTAEEGDYYVKVCVYPKGDIDKKKCDTARITVKEIECNNPGETRCANKDVMLRCTPELKRPKCTTDADCDKGYSCVDGECVKVAVECQNCFDWLRNKIQPGYCKPRWLIGGECKWYDVICRLAPSIHQDRVCPLVILIYFTGISIIVILVIKIVKRKK